MDKLQIGRNWSGTKGKLMHQYGSLTENDLAYEEGKERELVIRLQHALRRKRVDIVNLINYHANAYAVSEGHEAEDRPDA